MANDKAIISILLVDDVPEARETIKKLLAFEPDFKVVGTAGNGREGVQQAKELKPDIVIMDINMPDMDGLEAASLITKAVPATGVIMMSVQNDADYMRRAMLAGARNFLSKPVDMDELYATIRNVYQQYEQIRIQIQQLGAMANVIDMDRGAKGKDDGGGRGAHVIVVYSPKGGVGTTTIATNLASGLMRENIKVLLVDASAQFGDVGAFLNINGPTSILDLLESVEDLDLEYIDSIVMTHDSGLKVLIGPPRPEQAEKIRANPGAIGTIIDKVSSYYDFVVVDTNTAFDEVLLPVLDVADRVVLITTPTLPSVNSVRHVMDLFDQLGYGKEKTFLTINQAADDRNRRSSTIPPETIQKHLKHPVRALIPLVEERIILGAINKGVPVIALERDQTRPPVKQFMEMADRLFTELMGEEKEAEPETQKTAKQSRFGILGR